MPAGARARHRTGAATVEFAVVLALFLSTYLYGMLEVSRGIMVYQTLNNAARIGCRAGAQSGNGNSDITTAVSDVMMANGLNTYELVRITVSDSSDASNTTDAGLASSGSTISVQVSIKPRDFAWIGSYMFFKSATNGGTDTPVYSQNLSMRKQ
jgi:Flp pilus assembly protein TadG